MMRPPPMPLYSPALQCSSTAITTEMHMGVKLLSPTQVWLDEARDIPDAVIKKLVSVAKEAAPNYKIMGEEKFGKWGKQK